MRLDRVGGVAALDASWDGLFAAGPGMQSRRAWMEATEAAALPAGARPLYLALRDETGPLALLPMQVGPGRRAGSLTSPYSVLYQPLFAPGMDVRVAGRAWGRALREWPVVLLEALDPDWPGLLPLLSGLHRAGLVTARYEHFGNWSENVAGVSWEAYLAGRPGALRETIRRRGRAAERDGTVRIAIARDPAEVGPALDAYEAIYARSWKVPEPFPDFNAALLHRAAAVGALRLGVMWRGETPVAAQYWTVDGGEATVLKLAHDEAARALSPGTVLTAHMIRALLGEGVRRLDFGRGDDPYKRPWASGRTQRIGVLVANPLHPAGLAALARHWAGVVRRGLSARRPVTVSAAALPRPSGTDAG